MMASALLVLSINMIVKFRYSCCCGDPAWSNVWYVEQEEKDKEAFKSQCCRKCGGAIREKV